MRKVYFKPEIKAIRLSFESFAADMSMSNVWIVTEDELDFQD